MKNRAINHSDNWQTPPYFFDEIKTKYRFNNDFDFDPCPLNHNLEEWDGLEVPWGYYNFVNPGYSLKVKTDFVYKALDELDSFKSSLFLIPTSMSTVLYHKYIKLNMQKQEFIEGRIPFIGVNTFGQRVNCHLNGVTTTKETIEYNDPKKGLIEIPKYVKASGQHDSMLILF